MIRSLSISFRIALVMTFATLATSTALAETPEEVAERCIAQIRLETATVVERAAHVCDRTVTIIRERLEEGDERGARAAARAGAERIATALDRASGRIADGARQCLRQLRRAGASRELMRTVRSAAEHAATTLENSERRCLRAIRAAAER